MYKTFTQNTASLKEVFRDWRISNYEHPPMTAEVTLQVAAGGHERASDTHEEEHAPVIGGRIRKAIQILRE